ncbi:hypothetical protein CCR94_12815 [Rhodoblastus sphagnicola]|uniref:Uncharacterized protein n=1 Tax=Rhodoblastus sphagnicola TaxID=333368 RepID=A0A2S6N6G7_9HYPH|nr:hypothetical protein [Rhodoblastus sphagnicola]MBB4197697.1 hypothetical protein [Rhodoblastus sphagnicola]PPQ30204.1 hypothetical protein CCR94_12815 [Rhodoblastus sphagnicola]
MPEWTQSDPGNDVTTARARLNGLDIDVTHQKSPSGAWEEVSITLRASPSFEALGRSLAASDVFSLWARASRLMWMPWMLAAQPMLPAIRRRPPEVEDGK